MGVPFDSDKTPRASIEFWSSHGNSRRLPWDYRWTPMGMLWDYSVPMRLPYDFRGLQWNFQGISMEELQKYPLTYMCFM